MRNIPLHSLHRLLPRFFRLPRFSLRMLEVVVVVLPTVVAASLGLQPDLFGFLVNLGPFFLRGARLRRQSGRLPMRFSLAKSSVFFMISSNVRGSESEFLKSKKIGNQ